MIVEYALNRALPTEISDLFRYLNIGTCIKSLFESTVETPPIVADVATLLRRPALVQAVNVTIGGSTGPKTPVPFGAVPAAGQCVIDSDNHTITFAAADAVTACTVEYHALPTQADNIDAEWFSRP